MREPESPLLELLIQKRTVRLRPDCGREFLANFKSVAIGHPIFQQPDKYLGQACCPRFSLVRSAKINSARPVDALPPATDGDASVDRLLIGRYSPFGESQALTESHQTCGATLAPWRNAAESQPLTRLSLDMKAFLWP